MEHNSNNNKINCWFWVPVLRPISNIDRIINIVYSLFSSVSKMFDNWEIFGTVMLCEPAYCFWSYWLLNKLDFWIN